MLQSVIDAFILSWSMKVREQRYVFHLEQDGQNKDPSARNHDPFLIVLSGRFILTSKDTTNFCSVKSYMHI